MPYKKGTMPTKLQGKGIPQRYANIWINVFNSHIADHPDDEAGAFRRAYGVMSKELRKGGYRQDSGGSWKKSRKKKEARVESLILSGEQTNLQIVGEDTSLVSALEGGLRLKGVALVDHAVSQQGSGYERYYSPEFNTLCMEQSVERIKRGFPCTVYNRHGAALGGLFSSSDKSPVGIIESFERGEDQVEFVMFVSPTSEGRDLIQLCYDGVLGPTSVRIYDPVSVAHSLDDEDEDEDRKYGEISEMLDGYIGGIDFCDSPGINGAGIVGVLESMPGWKPISEEESMEISELTMESLREERPDLVEEIAASTIEALGERGGGEQVATLEEQVATLEETVANLTLVVRIEQAAQIGVGRKTAELLRERVASLEDIETELPKARAEALDEFTRGLDFSKAPTPSSGNASPQGDEDDPPKPEAPVPSGEELVTESQRRILRYAR